MELLVRVVWADADSSWDDMEFQVMESDGEGSMELIGTMYSNGLKMRDERGDFVKYRYESVDGRIRLDFPYRGGLPLEWCLHKIGKAHADDTRKAVDACHARFSGTETP